MMKLYYLTVGLAGMAAVFYMNYAYTAEPLWVVFLTAYACGTCVGTAIGIHIRELRDVKQFNVTSSSSASPVSVSPPSGPQRTGDPHHPTTNDQRNTGTPRHPSTGPAS